MLMPEIGALSEIPWLFLVFQVSELNDSKSEVSVHKSGFSGVRLGKDRTSTALVPYNVEEI